MPGWDSRPGQPLSDGTAMKDYRVHKVSTKRTSPGRSQSARGPSVDVVEGQQSSEELIAQAGSLLTARRRIEKQIKVNTDRGNYTAVSQLVRQRDNINKLLRDVFAFADDNLNGNPDSATWAEASAVAKAAVQEVEMMGSEAPIQERTEEEKARLRVAQDRTIRQPRLSAPAKQKLQRKYSKQRLVQTKKSVKPRPTSAPPGGRAAASLRNDRPLGSTSREATKARMAGESKTTITAQWSRHGYKMGTVASTSSGVMQSGVAPKVGVPLLRHLKKGELFKKNKTPGPGEYNLDTAGGNFGYKSKGVKWSNSKRSMVENRTSGAAADYDTRTKIGHRGVGFSKAGAGFYLWYHEGCWCLGLGKHLRSARTRMLCAAWIASEAEDPTEIEGTWYTHTGRNRKKAFGDHRMESQFEKEAEEIEVATKTIFTKKKSFRSSNGSSGGSRSSSPKKAQKTPGPPTLYIHGFKAFHGGYSGDYMKDPTLGLVNGRAVFRMVKASEETKMGAARRKAPGPGVYELEKDISKSGSKACFESKPVRNDETDTPGPSKYNTRDNPLPRNKISFGVGGRLPWGKRPGSPGPGDYDPATDIDMANKHAPTPALRGGGLKMEKTFDSGAPGPGHYVKHFY